MNSTLSPVKKELWSNHGCTCKRQLIIYFHVSMWLASFLGIVQLVSEKVSFASVRLKEREGGGALKKTKKIRYVWFNTGTLSKSQILLLCK